MVEWEYHFRAEKHKNMPHCLLISSQMDFDLLFLNLSHEVHFLRHGNDVCKGDAEKFIFRGQAHQEWHQHRNDDLL